MAESSGVARGGACMGDALGRTAEEPVFSIPKAA